MSRLFLHLLVVATILLGAPYAGMILYRVMGPWSAVGIEADGSRTHMEFGPDLPRPAWVPVPPDASVVQASRSVSTRWPDGFHILELASRAPVEELKAFYTAQLTGVAFDVRDIGIGPMNAATANYLGVAGMLEADRPATGDHLSIQIGTLEGVLVPSRLVKLHWYKLSNPGFAYAK